MYFKENFYFGDEARDLGASADDLERLEAARAVAAINNPFKIPTQRTRE
jgi:hypothetical protein